MNADQTWVEHAKSVLKIEKQIEQALFVANTRITQLKANWALNEAQQKEMASWNSAVECLERSKTHLKALFPDLFKLAEISPALPPVISDPQ